MGEGEGEGEGQGEGQGQGQGQGQRARGPEGQRARAQTRGPGRAASWVIMPKTECGLVFTSFCRSERSRRVMTSSSILSVDVIKSIHCMTRGRRTRRRHGHGSQNNRCEGLFCTYAYPAPYPEGTRTTRIRLEAIF